MEFNITLDGVSVGAAESLVSIASWSVELSTLFLFLLLQKQTSNGVMSILRRYFLGLDRVNTGGLIS
jgi:hypothetical protein